jgi:fibronectin type 3 domain-containing protein
MRVRWLGIAMSVVVLAWAPAHALGHDVTFRTEAQHLAEDDVVHTAAMEARLTKHTRQATAADVRAAAAAVVGNEHDVGSWGPLTDWPLVPVHAALLPNGKVLAYDNVGDGAAETYTDHTFSRATVWDPATGTQTPVWVNTGYNIFCSGLAHLPDGSLFVAGGNKNAQLEGIVQTHVFNYFTNTWSLGPDMANGRWYPTVTPLRTGEMLISDQVPELRMTNGGLRSLNEAVYNDIGLYPWLDAAPDGRTFMSGPTQTMRMLDTYGSGAWQSYGQRDSLARDYGSHALYDVGKILVAGGGDSSKDARVIDLNGSVPQVTPTAPMANGRRQHNLTVLADGTVLATGGNSSGASLYDLANGVYAGEQWNPATGTWKTLAPESATRQYHSTALLLADGRVLSAGGGVCGGCDAAGYLNKNGQVFSPPYLFNADGSLAARPTIGGAPASVTYGADLQIDTPDAAAIRKVALVRLGAVTHSLNMEQRYVPLSFTAATGSVTATAPANPNLAPPGVYMLFILNANGVPSVAKMVTVGGPPPDASPPTAPSGLTASPVGGGRVDLAWTAASDGVGVTGYRVQRCAGPGCTDFTDVGAPTPRVYTDAGLSASTTYRYRVQAADAGGNLGPYSNVVDATTGASQPPPVGLVGAWPFGEGIGSTVADASGNGNTGTITGATWSTHGRFGNALRFDDIGDRVRVASSASLNLGTAMTLSAWVQPTSPQGDWRTIMHREADAYFLTASSGSPLSPAGGGTFGGGVQTIDSPTAIPYNGWTYVAVTYDGNMLRLYLNGTQAAAVAAGGAIKNSTNPLWFGGDNPYGEYFQGLIDEVRVYNRALTQAEVQSDMNTPVVPAAADTTPPSTPSGLAAAPVSGNQMKVSWTEATDDAGVLGYRLERCQGAGCTNFAQVASPAWIGYDDAAVAGSTTYRYRVRTADQAGNVSAYSAIATATTPGAPDTTPPSAPTGLTPTVVSSSQIDLAWTASTDTVGVTGYRVERCAGASCTNFAQVGTPATTAFSNTGLTAGTTYRFRVRAVDAAGNLGAYSAIATAATPGAGDTTPPSAPTGLTPTVVSTSRIDLAWTASTDNVGVTGYRVERCQGTSCTNWAQVGTPTTTSFSNTGLAANTTYRFRVRAVDQAGNLSAYSAIASGRTQAADTTAPTAPTGLTAAPQSPAQVNLAWTASTDNVGVTGYRVERCQGSGCTTFAQVGTPITTGYSDTGLTASTTYRYRVRAADAAGNLSAYSSIVTTTTPGVPDNSPPSAPTGLTATAVGSSQVDLSWSAATDDVGVAGYRVERCTGQACTGFTQIAPPTATSYSDTGLTASTTYRYRVRAVDAAGNLGAYSDVAEATTGVAPPIPPGLVGGWAFSEGTGSTAADASGNGNAGTITNATWSTQGRYGNALSFNGTNSSVRVASSMSLNLATAMTLSAWVRPSASQNGWRTIVQRQPDTYLLHASSTSALRPAGGGTLGGSVEVLTGPAAIPVSTWTHVAMTYDGAMLRLYVNGTQVAARAAAGAIQSVANPLWIGGNQPYGEYFQGLIDEVRVYNRALTQGDIQTDMNASVGGGAALAGLAGLRPPSLLL